MKQEAVIAKRLENIDYAMIGKKISTTIQEKQKNLK